MKMFMGFIVLFGGSALLSQPIIWAMNNWSPLFVVACLPAGIVVGELMVRVTR